MMASVSATWPMGAALSRRIDKAMDVILHIGAHRCASTSFQRYLRAHSSRLERDGIGVWGPRRTRSGLFHALLPAPDNSMTRTPRQCSIGRVRLKLAENAGRFDTLIVSDENLMGKMRQNTKDASLYNGVRDCMARVHQMFESYVSDVVLNIRSLDTYWASVMGYGVARGYRVPDARDLDRLVRSKRSWRDVVTDVAHATPGARLWVLPFETFAGRPDIQLAALANVEAPRHHLRDRINTTPCLSELKQRIDPTQAARLPDGNGRWNPFSPEQVAVFRESYADDVMWLMAGADGQAWLMDDPDTKWTGLDPVSTKKTRGSPNDDQERRMESAG